MVHGINKGRIFVVDALKWQKFQHHGKKPESTSGKGLEKQQGYFLHEPTPG